MTKYGIEYAHIYTDRQFSQEQKTGLDELHKLEPQYPEGKRIVLIDDYSPAVGLDRFSLSDYLHELTLAGAKPDVVVAEGALAPYCQKVLDLVKDKKLAKGLNKYIATRGKYPCSLFVATWYLLRLGAWGEVSEVECLEGRISDIYSEMVVTILPYSYETPESQALQIIQATEFAPLTDRVVNHYFDFTPDAYSEWDEFDVDEYVTRNYGQVLTEDDQIIKTALDEIKQFGLANGSISTAIDVGMGGNLYPSMLIAPLLSDKASLLFQDYANSNVESIVEDLADPDYIDIWKPFNRLMEQYGGSNYKDALNTVKDLADVRQGSIFDLPANAYEAVLSFFVAESITDDYDTFASAVAKTINSLKSNGLLISTHMVGSEGYYAGERTSFPAVKISVSELESLYSGLPVKIYTFNHQGQSAARLKGYKGMALVVGRKTDK